MAATGWEKDIDLPGPRARTRGTLLSVARRIPDEALTSAGVNRLTGGITWLPWGVGNLSVDAANCDVDYNKVARTLPPVMFQPAFLIYDSLTCSNLSGMLDELWRRIGANLDVYLSAAFADQLEDASEGGLGLIGANNYDAAGTDYAPTVVTSGASSLKLAMVLLEDHLAAKLHGGLGVIHLTAGLLALAVAEGLVDWEDGAYRTPTGHAVIGDAGHTGTDQPNGAGAPGAGNVYIYATGDIWYAVQGVDRRPEAETGEGYQFIRRNVDRPLGELYGVLAFDPSVVGTALVDISDSTGDT
jgi:hypothetical protein